MWNVQPSLIEQYFVSSFINGLTDEVRPLVKVMQSATVKQAAKKAQLQELALEAIFKKCKMSPRTMG